MASLYTNMMKFIKNYMKTRKKKLQELEKLNKYLTGELNRLEDHIEGIVTGAHVSLQQAYINTREMFLGPGEFIIGNSNPKFKSMKIMIDDEDITDKVSKLVISGVDFIELE